MLILRPQGLFCPGGNFFIDPKGAVDHAIITHAHSDHARRGAKHYYCAASGVGLLRQRLGQNISVCGINFGEEFQMGAVKVSLHPAGHILGSAQVRIEHNGEVWLASGDYKRASDPTCEPFEIVKSDVFITEATFGTPAYKWDSDSDVGKEIFDWWMGNREKGINSVLFAYSLGKAQRILGLLFPHTKLAVHCHPASIPLTECYRAQGINLVPTVCLSSISSLRKLSGELFLVPQSFLSGEQRQILGESFETAFASGWMAQNRFGQQTYDRGFVLSDHADWKDLVRTVLDTEARRVYVQHRGNGALVKHLNSVGIKAFADSALIPENPDQMVLF